MKCPFISLIFLKRSLVFPILLLFSMHSIKKSNITNKDNNPSYSASLCAGNYSKHLALIFFLSSFNKWRNWGMERLSNFLKLKQLAGDRAEFESKRLTVSYFIVTLLYSTYHFLYAFSSSWLIQIYPSRPGPMSPLIWSLPWFPQTQLITLDFTLLTSCGSEFTLGYQLIYLSLP